MTLYESVPDKEQLLTEKYKLAITAILGTDEWKLTYNEGKSSFDEKLDVGHYELRFNSEPRIVKVMVGIDHSFEKRTDPVAEFQLHSMVGCCGICISTRASVRPSHYNKGLGTLLNSLRIEIARNLGYGVLLCTDVEQNTSQRKILKRNGWTDVHKFINPRTKNTCFISLINL